MRLFLVTNGNTSVDFVMGLEKWIVPIVTRSATTSDGERRNSLAAEEGDYVEASFTCWTFCFLFLAICNCLIVVYCICFSSLERDHDMNSAKNDNMLEECLYPFRRTYTSSTMMFNLLHWGTRIPPPIKCNEQSKRKKLKKEKLKKTINWLKKHTMEITQVCSCVLHTIVNFVSQFPLCLLWCSILCANFHSLFFKCQIDAILVLCWQILCLS